MLEGMAKRIANTEAAEIRASYDADTVDGLTVVGFDLFALIQDHSIWSQNTFGSDAVRGPIGAMKHLAKEAVEAQSAWESGVREATYVELADCFLLLLDAARRSGLEPASLITYAAAKMKVNRARTWPTPSAGDDPVEHVKAGSPCSV